MPCPVIEASNILGKKWTVPIIEDIALGNFIGFNDFARRIKSITSTRLSGHLKELEASGMIRKLPARQGSTTRYALTEKGASFHRLIQEIKQWSIRWNDVPSFCLAASCAECGKLDMQDD